MSGAFVIALGICRGARQIAFAVLCGIFFEIAAEAKRGGGARGTRGMRDMYGMSVRRICVRASKIGIFFRAS